MVDVAADVQLRGLEEMVRLMGVETAIREVALELEEVKAAESGKLDLMEVPDQLCGHLKVTVGTKDAG